MFFAIFSFSVLLQASASSAECVPYQSTDTSLHCGTVFSECDYILPPDNLNSLDEPERQLGELLHQAESEVTSGELCIDRFISLYCHQVYTPCNLTTDGQYMPTDQPVCQSDCDAVIGSACNLTQWSTLRGIVEVARNNGTVQTPPLRPNCTDLPVDLESCTMIEQGKNVASLQTRIVALPNSALPLFIHNRPPVCFFLYAPPPPPPSGQWTPFQWGQK